MANTTASGRLRVVVVTPERAVLDEPADLVTVPMYDGELGVLPKRAPLVGRLGPGELRFRQGNAVKRFFVDGGFAQVRADVVTVLTNAATPAEALDVAAAAEAVRSVESVPAAMPSEREAKAKALDRARALARVAARR